MPDPSLSLPDASATEALGAALWRAWTGEPLVVVLEGDLGAGKTTLVRGVLAAAGHAGPVRSPTYTLVEPYDLEGRRVLHLDLYRLGSPLELEELGLRDELHGAYLLLAEWPERGAGVLPEPALRVRLSDAPGGGRTARLLVGSPTGSALREAVQSEFC